MKNIDLKLYKVSSIVELEKIRGSWNHLVNQNPTSTPFQLWEWNYGIVKYMGNKVRLHIVVAENNDGEIVGIAPFWVRSISIMGLKVLEFIGSSKSDYLDLLYLELYKDTFVQQLLEWLQLKKTWRIMDLKGLRQESIDIFTRFGSFLIQPYDACYYANLPNTMHEYERKTMQKRLRKNIHQRFRKLDNEKRDLAFSVSKTDEELQKDLTLLIDLHQKRQQSKGERGRFIDPRWREVFSGISFALFQAGYLRIGVLRIDGTPLACHYNLLFRDQEYAYMGGIDDRLSWYSPGSLLDYLMIEDSIMKERKVYDFLRGDDAYKSKWTNDICPLFQLIQARTKAEVIVWRKIESYRNAIYRSRFIKKLYHATVGKFKKTKNEIHDV